MSFCSKPNCSMLKFCIQCVNKFFGCILLMLSSLISQITRPNGCDELHAKYQVSERQIGRGSFGVVYDAVDKITGKKVAIKKLTYFPTDLVHVKQLLREISLLRMLKSHPNIISLEYIASSSTKDTVNEVHLVFERYDTDLNKIISSKQSLSTQHLQYFLYQIFCGVYYIHSAKLVHRDLKPSNILVNSNCDIKICDFGLARATQIIKETSHTANGAPPPLFRQLTEYVVTRWYRSPELIINHRAEAPADIWSVGCILAELLLREPLFPADSSIEVLKLILKLTGTPVKHDRRWIDDETCFNYLTQNSSQPRQSIRQKFKGEDASALDLLEKLLEFNPTRRISAAQALRHSFFHSLFNSQDVLTFPLKARSAAEVSSLNDYYQFETELDDQSDKSQAAIAQCASALILKEIARYAPDSSSTPAAATSSFITTSSFFQDRNDPAKMINNSLKLFSGAPHFWSDDNKHKTLRSNVVPYSFESSQKK